MPTGGRRQQLEDAVTAIYEHVRQTGRAGIYGGRRRMARRCNGQAARADAAGPGPGAPGERVDGADRSSSPRPDESREDVQYQLYPLRHYASPRVLTRHRIAEVLYAGKLLEPVPASQVDDTVDLVLQAMAHGRLHPRMLAAHGQGLREYLGLPTAP